MTGLAPQLVSGSSSSEGTPPSTWGRSRFVDVGIFLFAAILIALASWSSYHAELRHDQYQLILLGKTLLDGDRLYVDCWENKPPGIAWINALGLMIWREGAIGPWLLPGPLIFSAMSLFYVAVRRRIGIAAARCGFMLGSLVYSLRMFDTPSINPDFYSSALELIAFSLWMAANRGFPRRTTPQLRHYLTIDFTAGLIWAAATTVKQVAWVGLFALTVIHLISRGYERLRDGKECPLNTRSSSLWANWLGFVFGMGLVAGVLAYQGVLHEAWYAIFTFNTELASPSALRYGWSQVSRLTVDLAPLSLPIWLAVVGFFASAFRRKTREPIQRNSRVEQVEQSRDCEGAVNSNLNDRPRPGISNPFFVSALALWLMLAIVFALLGPSRAMRYWQSMFPPMLWLAAIGGQSLADLFRRTNGETRVALAISMLTLVALLGQPLWDEHRSGVASMVVALERGSNERAGLIAVAAHVQKLTQPSDRILVIGYHPGIYLYSDRRPACRFNGPRSVSQMEEILTAIESSHAQLVLVPPEPERVLGAYGDDSCKRHILQALDKCTPVGETGGFRFLGCPSEGVWTGTAP